MKFKKPILLAFLVLLVAAAGYTALRGYRAAHASLDLYQQVKLLIESGGTIGEAPASQAFSVGYLDAIFGDNPALLGEVKKIVQSGLSDAPQLSLGTVSAMIITYHQNRDNSIRDVVAHVVGGFPIGKLKPGFHRDGFFQNLIDQDLWASGNQTLGLLGRDMVIFASEEVADDQRALIEGLTEGNILPLVDVIETPLKFSIVLPDPRNLVPRQLSRHIQAMILKGTLSQEGGEIEAVLLTPSKRSANFSLAILHDMLIMSQVALKTKFGGMIEQHAWGAQPGVWWAHEMVKISEDAVLEREENILQLSVAFDRVGMNVVLKTLERMGRDLAQSRMSLEERMDPRLADRRLQSRKQSHYWSEPHRWGPNWPLAASTNEVSEYQKAREPQAAPTAPAPPSDNIPAS